MNTNLIFWPVLAQIFLTLILFIILGMRKSKAVKAGDVNRKQAALNNQVWPEAVLKVGNNITNQFEIPALFYVLCLISYGINSIDMVLIVLAWLFVASRFAHAYVHIGSNYVPMRFRLFLFGCFVIIAMFILVTWKITTGE